MEMKITNSVILSLFMTSNKKCNTARPALSHNPQHRLKQNSIFKMTKNELGDPKVSELIYLHNDDVREMSYGCHTAKYQLQRIIRYFESKEYTIEMKVTNSVLLSLFMTINEKCHTGQALSTGLSGTLFSECQKINSVIPKLFKASNATQYHLQ